MSGALGEPLWGQHFKSEAGMRVLHPRRKSFQPPNRVVGFRGSLSVLFQQFLFRNELLCITIRPRQAAEQNNRQFPTSYAYLYTAQTAGLFCNVHPWVVSLHHCCSLLPRRDNVFRDTKCIASTQSVTFNEGSKVISCECRVKWSKIPHAAKELLSYYCCPC